MKLCPGCKKLKSVKEFWKCDWRDGLQVYCKKCKSNRQSKSDKKSGWAYSKKYYQEHKEWYKKWSKKYNEKPGVKERKIETQREWRALLKKTLLEILGGVCVKCGFSDVRALQIDHINGGGFKAKKAVTRNYYKEVIESVMKKGRSWHGH